MDVDSDAKTATAAKANTNVRHGATSSAARFTEIEKFKSHEST